MAIVDSNPTEYDVHQSIIEESLQRVLESSRFKNAVQLQSLLKFIVESAIHGRDDLLKERIIGMSVFGRKADYETADDPIVRSRVGQVRRRLDQYYESDESKGIRIRIVIPSGTYRPTFVLSPGASGGGHFDHAALTGLSRGNDTDEDLGNPSTTPIVSTLPPTQKRLVWALAAASGFFLMLVGSVVYLGLRPSKLDLFWSPVTNTERSVLICDGTISAFKPTADYWKRVRPLARPEEAEGPGLKMQLPTLQPGEQMSSTDFDIIPDGFMSPGDVAATISVIAFLNNRRHSYDLRTEPSLSIVDLLSSPAVMIGAYNNTWTMDLNRALPIFFDRGGSIRERNGAQRVWSEKPSPDITAEEDYAIIARMLDSKTKHPVILLAGKRNCGTEAAAEFATDPHSWNQEHDLSRDMLNTKNIELLIHVGLDHCKPTSTTVIALKVW
jgi:hypothetical protein